MSKSANARPFWAELILAVAPMALSITLWLGVEYRHELLDAATRLREAVVPPRLEADTSRLAWMRARWEAGGYAEDGGPSHHGA